MAVKRLSGLSIQNIHFENKFDKIELVFHKNITKFNDH